MRGKIIKLNAKRGVFVQIDKNNQICDLYAYDRSFPKEERVRERLRGRLFDMFKGQPLYSAWKSLIEEVNLEARKEKEVCQA